LEVRSPGCIWLAIRSAGLRDTLATWQLLTISGHAQLGYVHSPEEANDLLLQFTPDTSLTPGHALGGLWLWRSAVESPGPCGLTDNLDVAAGQKAD
jgi:hypothetical protein